MTSGLQPPPGEGEPETFGLSPNLPHLAAKLRTLAITDPELFAIIIKPKKAEL